jgi:predicted nucleotidyltransferase
LILCTPEFGNIYSRPVNPNATLPVLDGKIEELAALCRRFHVKRLEIFGSAVTGTFRPGSSDLDFVVDFGDQPLGSRGALLLDFADALETLFGRHVDLVMPQSIRNPYFQKAVDSSRQLVYEAGSEKAPL